jgi:2-hydroxychromene-2-carboxylate isomerase
MGLVVTAASLDFFFFYGSIYTYLAVMRIDALAASAGVNVVWRPFNLREMLIEQNNTAFVRNPVRMNYCWRDVERRAARHGLPFVPRPPHPVDPELLALRIGIIAAGEGWCAEYTKATYRAWFIDHKVTGSVPTVEAVLGSLQKPADQIIVRAGAGDVHARLKGETEAARKLGIFGSPTFAIGTEIFWGDDRLEEALDWASSSKRHS